MCSSRCRMCVLLGGEVGRNVSGSQVAGTAPGTEEPAATSAKDEDEIMAELMNDEADGRQKFNSAKERPRRMVTFQGIGVEDDRHGGGLEADRQGAGRRDEVDRWGNPVPPEWAEDEDEGVAELMNSEADGRRMMNLKDSTPCESAKKVGVKKAGGGKGPGHPMANELACPTLLSHGPLSSTGDRRTKGCLSEQQQ